MNNRIISLMIMSICMLILINNDSRTQDYYPLKIGNRWDYVSLHFDPINLEVDSSFSSVKVIGDSLFPNGELYYILDNYDITGGKYVRADSRFIYYYDDYPEESEDTLYRIFSEVGETWQVLFLPITHVTLEVKDTVWIFSNMTAILGFELDGLMVYYNTLSDKFGPVRFYWTGEPPGTDYRENLLIGCIIDGVVYGDTLTVGVEDDVKSIALEFGLEQNYPNPFNPTTKIKYSIPVVRTRDRVSVQLKIYDVLGNEIATPVNEEKSAGSYEFEFDGSRLTSGIYFYRLQAGEYTTVKKMILLK